MIATMIFSAVHLLDSPHPSASLTGIGIMVALHVTAMYSLSPVMGVLADRVGRRPTIAGGILLIGGGCLTTATSHPSLAATMVGLTSIGLGWSACMVAGSTLLSESVDQD